MVTPVKEKTTEKKKEKKKERKKTYVSDWYLLITYVMFENRKTFEIQVK